MTHLIRSREDASSAFVWQFGLGIGIPISVALVAAMYIGLSGNRTVDLILGIVVMVTYLRFTIKMIQFCAACGEELYEYEVASRKDVPPLPSEDTKR